MKNKNIMPVMGNDITVFQFESDHYLSLTDMMKGFGDDAMIGMIK